MKKLKSSTKLRLSLLFIVLLTLFAALLDFPQALNKTVLWSNIP